MKKTAGMVEHCIKEAIDHRLTGLIKNWGIDTSNGTFQKDPRSKIYRQWKDEGKLTEYLQAFEVYLVLMDLLDGIQSGDFIDIYADTYKK